MPARDPRLPPPLPAFAEANPYAAPSAVVADVMPGLSQAEAVRREHIRHERQVKSIGSVYYLLTAMFALGSIAVFVARPTPISGMSLDSAFLAFYAFLLFLFGALGYGFRRMRPWVRIPGGIVSALWLLRFPVGTILGIWVLWVMFCQKGQTILSPSYAEIVKATPHVKYVWTLGDKIATTIIVLILAGVATMFVVALMG